MQISGRLVVFPLVAAILVLAAGTPARAQDVPGIELCTRESSMERRTGCLQSNVEYLQRLVAKNAAAAQQKLDAANAEIAALKAALASLQASVAKLSTAPGKPADIGTPASAADGK